MRFTLESPKYLLKLHLNNIETEEIIIYKGRDYQCDIELFFKKYKIIDQDLKNRIIERIRKSIPDLFKDHQI